MTFESSNTNLIESESDMKTEYCVMRDRKIWFKCSSEAEAIEVAKHYNAHYRAPDTSEYMPCTRQVSEWKRL